MSEKQTSLWRHEEETELLAQNEQMTLVSGADTTVSYVKSQLAVGYPRRLLGLGGSPYQT